MKEKAFEKVTEYIDALASQLGVAAEHVFEVLVRQQFAEGIADTILGAVFAVIVFVVLRLTLNVFTKAEYEGRGFSEYPKNTYAKLRDFIDDTEGLFWIFYVIIVGLGAVFAIGNLYFGILALFNPEYYAIKELLDVLGGK